MTIFWLSSWMEKVKSRAENPSARAMAQASSARTHHYYLAFIHYMQASQSIALQQFLIRSEYLLFVQQSWLGPKKQDFLPKIKNSQRKPQYYSEVNYWQCQKVPLSKGIFYDKFYLILSGFFQWRIHSSLEAQFFLQYFFW